MWRARAVRGAGLGGSDIESVINEEGIGGNNFAIENFAKLQTDLRFAAGRRPGENEKFGKLLKICRRILV